MKIKKQILIVLMIISVFINTFIYANPVQAATNTKAAASADFTVAAEGAVMIESTTGKILFGKNENEKLYPASTTKILTAIIAIENCNPTDKITASYNAVMSLPAGYSNAAIQPGETLGFQELLEMFLVHSANEIGTIFAEHVSGSVEKFAVLMNQKAASIGCKNTHFTNPSGIHDVEHYSTAYDMALIAQYCMKNELFRKVVSMPSCRIAATEKYEERYFRNTNDLLNSRSKYYYEYAIGTKTGYTSQAKRCLIATALKDNLELITVILGDSPTLDDSRYLDTVKMFEYGFNNYKFQEVATQNTIIEEITVENATKETKNLSLLIKNDLTALVPKNITSADLKPSIHINEVIEAPISEGAVLGKITYTIEGVEYSSDLIANHSVEKFDIKTLLIQFGLVVLILFILSKMLLPKKKSKKRKNKKRVTSKKSNDSIYKF